MSIENEIIRLQNAKASIKTAIEGKGVTVGDDVKLDGYAALIDNISVGSGDGEEHVNPDFYNVRTNNGTNYSHLFSNYNGVNLDYISNWDTSKVESMASVFHSCSKLILLDLSKWNTSKVTNMSNMFFNCSKLTSVNLSSFNTSNVTTMNSMFGSCNSLAGALDLSNFNTSKLKDMNSMFQYCNKLTSVNLSGWDTSLVTNMNSLFYGSGNMALTHVYGELDLSGLSNGFYTGSYSNPLGKCVNLETLYLKNIYKNCTIKNESKWSINLGDTIIKDECLLYIIEQLPDLKNDKGLTTTSSIVLTLPKTNLLTEEQVKVATDKGWQVANTTYQLPSYSITYTLENIIQPEKTTIKEGMPCILTLQSTSDDYAIDHIEVTMGGKTITPTYIKDDCDFILSANINITSVTGDIVIIATAKEPIRYTSFIVGVADESINNQLGVTCSKSGVIKEITISGVQQTVPNNAYVKYYTVKNNDYIKIRINPANAAELYLSSTKVSSISNFVLQSNVTSLNCMFSSCINLIELDLSNLDTSNINNMRYMFSSCSSLTELDLSNFDTKNVTNMDSMFYSCSKLNLLDLSSFDTRNITNVSYNAISNILRNIPKECTIYINPDTFINSKTGQTFTPADLGWFGTAFTPKYN